jgi:hypothetical protein
MDPYKKLANAIIIQAAKDYRVALRELQSYADIEPELLLYENELAEGKAEPDDEKDRKLGNLKRIKTDIKEIEEFFHSKLYSILTDVDGQYILEELQKEVYGK